MIKSHAVYGLCAMVAILFLSACSYTPQRTWPDINFPTQSVKLEIKNAAGMNDTEMVGARTAFTKALNGLHIDVKEEGNRVLRVEVTNYNRQSLITTALKGIIQCVVPGPWMFMSSNTLTLNAELIEEDGSKIVFSKLSELDEGARNFEEIQETMARRVAASVLTARSLKRTQGLEYSQVSQANIQ